MKNTELKRINIRIPEYIQEYYKEQGEKYSVPYTNYIAMILTQVYENEQNNILVKEFNETLKSLKDTAGEVTVDQMMKQFKDMQDMVSKLEKE